MEKLEADHRERRKATDRGMLDHRGDRHERIAITSRQASHRSSLHLQLAGWWLKAQYVDERQRARFINGCGKAMLKFPPVLYNPSRPNHLLNYCLGYSNVGNNAGLLKAGKKAPTVVPGAPSGSSMGCGDRLTAGSKCWLLCLWRDRWKKPSARVRGLSSTIGITGQDA